MGAVAGALRFSARATSVLAEPLRHGRCFPEVSSDTRPFNSSNKSSVAAARLPFGLAPSKQHVGQMFGKDPVAAPSLSFAREFSGSARYDR